MWQNVSNWILGFIQSIPEFARWLFTPVNVNIMSQNLSSFQKELNQSGLSNMPTWIYDALSNASNPILITPIEIISVSFISLIFGVMVIKFLVK